MNFIVQDRAWKLGLVDETGMDAGIHQVDEQTFSARIPGAPPTASDRAKFVKPNMSRKEMSERTIGIELTTSIKSVLQAAATSGLRVLHTPPGKMTGDLGQQSDPVNRVGIYLNNETARRATTLTATDCIKQKFTREQRESGDFGRPSWYWMAVLGVAKSLDDQECAFYMHRHSLVASSDSLVDGDDPEAADCNVEEPRRLSTPGVEPDSTDDDADDKAGSPNPSTHGMDGVPFLRRTRGGGWALGELADCMFDLSTHQHRLFSYGFYVRWRWARLLYFDRAGVLVSEPFDWTETSSPLHDFVWKLAHMNLEELGYDPTVQEASYNDVAKVLRKAMDPSLAPAVRTYVQDTFFPKTGQYDHSGKNELQCDLNEVPVIYKLTVALSNPSPNDAFPDSEPTPPSTDGRTTSERAFLVGPPHFVADALIGRCTRGYIAFDLETEQFCFLKDSWRPHVLGRTRPEHLVYERLRSRGVRDRIATLVCGGDVGGCHRQLMDTHTFFPQSKQPIPRVHYRIVIREIGVPLTDFTTFGELNVVFLDAIIAHCMAWEKAGVLHRDISVGNILIDPVTRKGFLIDWDLSRLRSELEQGPVEPDRTGTWQFRSALCLAFPRKPYQLSDDIESFVHAYRWIVLRFHETDVPGLRVFVQMEYEHSLKTSITGIRIGGQQKMVTFCAPRSTCKVVNNVRLQGLLDDLAAGCFSHYEKIDKALMQLLYGVPKPTPKQPSKPEPAPTGDPRPGEPHDMADIMSMMEQDEPPSAEDEDVFNVPPRRHDVQPQTDPCKVVGFLSAHRQLVNVFRKWLSNAAPKQGDQFILRSAEDPVEFVFSVKANGISTMSQGQTVDSPITAPSLSELKKLRQDDDAEVDEVAPGNDASPSEASDPVQV